MTFDELLETAIRKNASDVLLAPRCPPALRIEGVLSFQDEQPLPPAGLRTVLGQLLMPEQQEHFGVAKALDFALEQQGRRFRCSAWLSGGNAGLSLRLLPATIPTPEKLGLPPILSQLVQQPQGLLLFTGGTGQGKSTTQAALIDLLNRTGPRLIITLEDPVEFVHHAGKAIIDQRDRGRDFLDYGDALRHVGRQRPDVIMLAEMADEAAIRAALTLAETGHLVLATVHTGNAVQAVARLIDGFEPGQQWLIRNQLAGVLLGVASHRLVPGTSGRLVLASEVLVNTAGVTKLIREGYPERIDGLMETESQFGSQTINQALEGLVRAERISAEVAQQAAAVYVSAPEVPASGKPRS